MRRKEARKLIKQYNLERAELLANQDKYDKHTFKRMLNQYDTLIDSKVNHIKDVDNKRNFTNIILIVISLLVCTAFSIMIYLKF